MEQPRIRTSGLCKSYGDIKALADVSLEAGPGRVLGVLGHNGAGKTTLVDLLNTRIAPTGGSASVCGWDVQRDAAEVRRRIGVTGQFVALDEALSGRANLVLLARLLGATRQQAESRSTRLLETLGLTDAADRKPSTYSGGMRRRLDLAAGLLGRPEVLFLDEPSAGLDPVGRIELWSVVRGLAADGTTVVLTTQDLQEAEELATDVVVLAAAGQVVARGTPDSLKANIGNRVATVTVADSGLLEKAVNVLVGANLPAVALPATGRPLLAVPMPEAARVVDLVRTLDRFAIPVTDITLAEPTLNDVYLALHYAGWKSC